MENVLQSSRCSSKRSEKSLQQKITVNAHHLSCGAHSKSIRNNFVHVSEMYKSVIINKTKIRRKKVVTSLELGFSVVDGILVFVVRDHFNDRIDTTGSGKSRPDEFRE